SACSPCSTRSPSTTGARASTRRTAARVGRGDRTATPPATRRAIRPRATRRRATPRRATPRRATRSRRRRSRSRLVERLVAGDAARAVEPGTGRRRLGGRVPEHHLDDGDVLLVAGDEAVAVVLAAEAAVQRRAGTELAPTELRELPCRHVRGERLHQVAAAERKPEERADARELAQR